MTTQASPDQQDKPTARGMIELLRAHYMPPSRPAAGIFASEIQAPDSERRADLIWQGCTAAAGRQLVGHEIKVTRQDLLAELTDPTKSDPWQRYCDRWWLVVPAPDLVDGLELPPTWGVLAPPSGRRRSSMTVVVPAPALRPAEQGPALRTLATWLHWKLNDARTTIAQRDAEIARQQATVNQLDERLAELQPRFASPARQRGQQVVAEIVRRLGGASPDGRVGTWEAEVSVDDVVAALSEYGALQARARDLAYRVRHTAQELQRALSGADPDQLKELATAVERFADAGNGVTE